MYMILAPSFLSRVHENGRGVVSLPVELLPYPPRHAVYETGSPATVLSGELPVYTLLQAGYLLIDHRPAGKSAYVPVVYEDVGLYLPRAREAVLVVYAGVMVAVDGRELKPLALAPVNCVLQELPGPLRYRG